MKWKIKWKIKGNGKWKKKKKKKTFLSVPSLVSFVFNFFVSIGVVD